MNFLNGVSKVYLPVVFLVFLLYKYRLLFSVENYFVKKKEIMNKFLK